MLAAAADEWHEFVVVDDAGIGVAIGENHDAAQSVGTLRSGQHLETLEPAARKVR